MLKVVTLYQLFKSDAAPGDSFQQYLDRRLEVDHQIGGRRLNIEALIDLLIQLPLLRVQYQFREQPVLLHQVVGHLDRAEQVALAFLLKLTGALKQEKQLHRQRAAARVLVKPLEEWVRPGLFFDQVASETVRQAPGEAGLADANRAFHHDITRTGDNHVLLSPVSA